MCTSRTGRDVCRSLSKLHKRDVRGPAITVSSLVRYYSIGFRSLVTRAMSLTHHRSAGDQAALYLPFHLHSLPVDFASAARQARSDPNAASKMPESANELPSTCGPQRQGAVGGRDARGCCCRVQGESVEPCCRGINNTGGETGGGKKKKACRH